MYAEICVEIEQSRYQWIVIHYEFIKITMMIRRRWQRQQQQQQPNTYRKLFTLVHNNIRLGFRIDRMWVYVRDREWVRCWSLLYLLCAYHTLVLVRICVYVYIYININMYRSTYMWMRTHDTKVKTILDGTHYVSLVHQCKANNEQ